MKMDLELNWQATINIGQFSNVQPGARLKLKDIDADDPEMYKKLMNVISPLWMMQMYNLLSEADTALHLGPRTRYFDALKDSMEDIQKGFDVAVKELGTEVTAEGFYGSEPGGR